MPSLKRLLIASCTTAAAGIVSIVITFLTNDWLPLGATLLIGLLCLLSCLGLAAWGLRVHSRRGLWLLMPVLPAGFAPLLILAGYLSCFVRSGCVV
jgi:hypothetical protein